MNRLTNKAPEYIKIKDVPYKINTDFRNCLKIIMAFEDKNLTLQEQYEILLYNLYSVDNSCEIKKYELILTKLINGLKEIQDFYNNLPKKKSLEEEKLLQYKNRIKKLKLDIEENNNIINRLIKEHNTIPQPILDNVEKAIELGVKFLDCGDSEMIAKIKYEAPLYSFSKDSKYIYASISKIGHTLDNIDKMHWWDFVALFMDICEGQFSHIIYLRNKNRKGKLTIEEKQECERIGWDVINMKDNISLNHDQIVKMLTGEDT